MQGKSLSLVVEEMTSLSRIIRSNAVQPEKKDVEIQLRNLFTVDFEDGNSIHQHTMTISDVYSERERLISQAMEQIEQQKQEFEQYRQAQLEKLEQAKQLWDEEKLVLEQNAYDSGFQKGYEEGMKKAQAEMELSLKVANEVVEDSRLNAQKYIEEQEQVILDIALTSAERIIGSALEKDENVYLSIIKRGLKEAREMKEIKLYVPPTYHRLVTQNRDELVAMFPTDVPFLIFVDEDLNDTDGYIETNHGRIVVSIDEQLNVLRIKLNEILEGKE